MSAPLHRSAAASSLRTLAALAAILFLAAPCARAVIVRGTVTDPLGAAVAGARVQLIQGKSAIAASLTGLDGSFEIRSTAPGRFLLLTSARTFTPNIGQDFYGGRTDVVTRNVTLEIASVTTAVTVTATGIPTPIQQVSSPVTLIPQSDLVTQVGIVDDLRQSPGAAAVQTGQYGGATSLFVRGGNSTANKVLIDGIPAEDVGGVFDFGNVSSTGLTGFEFYRGPNSVLYGSDAGASVVSLNSPRGNSLRPALNYSGDAGNFHTYRNEAALSGAWNRLDYYGAFSRFDSSNALPLDRFHSATSVANLGFNITANTQARFTLRNAVSASGLPSAHDFYGISSDGKQGDQDIYSGLTLENRALQSKWHNLVRYGIARKREQEHQFTNVGEPITYDFGGGDVFTEYFGNNVTIRGANGYTATGQASFFLPNEDSASNRDELYYQSDYAFTHHLTALFGFRYENERGSFVEPDFGEDEITKRTNYQYTLQFQGDIKSRLFYSLGGAIEKNHLYGVAGTPRIGLSYVPVRSGNGWFKGTKLRANVATGVQEPNLAIEFQSLYKQLELAGNTSAIAQYHITPVGAERSRTYDIGIDQNILSEKLILKAGYFHNIFDHQLEGVQSGALTQYFGLPPSVVSGLFSAYLNSLAFRAQGLETELQYQPTRHIFLRGGYTYLDAVVIQSFSGDAIAANTGNPTENPNLPGIAIGAESPLIGARPFRRPPHTGFFTAQYTTSKFSAALKGALASRSDDSTYLDGFDPNFGNSLILPNRDLDFGYAKLDANFLFAATNHVTIFSQFGNLLSQQHIGPIGYPGLPFTFRTGLKIRIGGN
ncbi:TonB-dependent receptor [Edaphobacter dinghuensis]|uniref:TonB-dependent receptor n=1 Tax=Edaphobacter dinghuensis TaxID=1560005 RepID=A0A917M4E2_9BACT|nr:TonB-dependent receptor [Edaphobacter dinghuensis]GGG76274.1 TonB-dependent receptor [Edaphobacter dinghuensis]